MKISSRMQFFSSDPSVSSRSASKTSCVELKYIKMSGSHLLSHAVARIVPSAVKVFTVVFGMGTGVSPSRITTGQIYHLFLNLDLLFLRSSLLTIK